MRLIIFRWLFIPVLFLGILQGCATFPETLSLSGHEKKLVHSAFRSLLERMNKCDCCLDANITLRFHSLFQSAAISGYFQAKSPSYIKFVGENPLGQPLIIFVTDGNVFSYATVMEQKIYEGSTNSQKYLKYAPAGFDSAYGYYWLTGRMWHEDYQIIDINLEKNGSHYWLEMKGPEGTIHFILFDLEQEVIRRHLLMDKKGKLQLDVQYERYALSQSDNADDDCKLPGFITIRSQSSNASIDLEFNDWISHPAFPDSDFNMYLPEHFEKNRVQ